MIRAFCHLPAPMSSAQPAVSYSLAVYQLCRERMDLIRNALTSLKLWLDWLPDHVVSLFILLLAGAIAYSLHKSVRKLLRAMLAERYPYILSVFTQMRGVTRLGLLILAIVIAIPAAPLDPATADWLGRAEAHLAAQRAVDQLAAQAVSLLGSSR